MVHQRILAHLISQNKCHRGDKWSQSEETDPATMGLYANQVCFTKRLKFFKFNFKTRKTEKPSEEIAMEYPLDYTEY